MINRVFILIIILICSKTLSIAQEISSAEFKKGTSLEEKLSNYINSLYSTTTRFNNRCGSGVSFIRFRIDIQGNVVNLESNDGSSVFLDTILKEGIMSTNGQWVPAKQDNRPVISKLYLLPVLFTLGPCRNEIPVPGETQAEALLRRIPDTIGLNKDPMIYSLLHMNDFNRTDDPYRHPYPPIEYIVLNPFSLILPRR